MLPSASSPKIKITSINFRPLLLRILVRILAIFTVLLLCFAIYKSFEWHLQHFNKVKLSIEFRNGTTHCWVAKPSEDVCNKDTKLLVMVLSRREAYANRVAIRSTWASQKSANISLRFVLGDVFPEKNHAGDIRWKFDNYYSQQNVTNVLEYYLKTENEQYKDLIFIEGIGDSYANLHLVVDAALQWQQKFCPQAKYLLKTDDDTVIELTRLMHWIEHKFDRELAVANPATCFGYTVAGSPPIRQNWHKWYVPEEAYPDSVYPNYLQGCTYLCSTKAVAQLLAHTKDVNAIGIEDVLFTGIVAERANVTRSDQRLHFWTGTFSDKMNCETGVPMITAIFSYMQTMDLYQSLYTKLANVQCS